MAGSDTRSPWLAAVDARVSAVVDPVASQCAGWPTQTLKPVLRRAWREAFHGELDEPGLTWCAEAIHDRRPWRGELWGTSAN